MNEELTDWFPPEIKPVHEGWYEAKKRLTENAFLFYWHGGKWKFAPIGHTSLSAGVQCCEQNKFWRGLAKNADRAFDSDFVDLTMEEVARECAEICEARGWYPHGPDNPHPLSRENRECASAIRSRFQVKP